MAKKKPKPPAPKIFTAAILSERITDLHGLTADRFDRLDTRLDSIETKIDAMGFQLGAVAGRVDSKIDAVNGKLDAVAGQLAQALAILTKDS
jgi:tetrahydromethanopterin S-methyltransferase subunit G